MGNKDPTGIDHRVAALAERQHGVVSRGQLRRLGRSDGAITKAMLAGRLRLIFRGVYAVGHLRTEQRSRMMAAVLACGSGTVVSHRSAAALLGLLDPAPVVVDVTASGDRGRCIDGIKAHKGRAPSPTERGTVDRIPCTSPARTLVDLAGICGERSLREAFELAAHQRQLDLDTVEAVLRTGRRRGRPLLRALLAEWRAALDLTPTQPVLRSPLEAKVLPLLARTDLPKPLINAPVQTPGGRLEVDLLWPAQHLAVELDSRRHHGTAIAFERDRRRDRELMRAGYATLRPTWHQVEHEPEAVVAAIAARLT